MKFKLSLFLILFMATRGGAEMIIKSLPIPSETKIDHSNSDNSISKKPPLILEDSKSLNKLIIQENPDDSISIKKSGNEISQPEIISADDPEKKNKIVEEIKKFKESIK